MQHSPFVVLLAFAAAGLLSQEPQRQGGPGGPGGFPGFALFGALNTDGGESLTAAEIDNASAILKKLDANGDGKVTPDEFPRPAPERAVPGADAAAPAWATNRRRRRRRRTSSPRC